MSESQTKPDLALIHGWGLGNSVWQTLLPALAPHFRLHLISLPGYDLANEPPETLVDRTSSNEDSQNALKTAVFRTTLCRTPNHAPSSAPTFEEAANSLIDTLPEGSIVCGWSLGSMLALRAARLSPGHFRKLILIGGTPSFAQREDWPHAKPQTLLNSFADAVAKAPAGTLQRFIVLLNQGDVQARLFGRSLTQQLMISHLPDTATLMAGLDWLRNVDLRDEIAAIALPTLLLHGEHDPLMPLGAAQWLQQALPNAQLQVINGAAHAAFLSDPDDFVARIVAFCNADCHAPAVH
jgi:pimeloyl-[acyl-carrier protein] methyl ester esterase